MKKLTVILWSLIFILTTMPASANNKWSAWLFNSTNNQLVRVYEDGTTESYTLPVAEGTLIVSQLAIFAGETIRVGFCSINFSDNPEAPPQTVQVINLNTNTVLVSQTLTGGDGCAVSRNSFSLDGMRLAVGTASEAMGNTWQLMILDVESGENLAELSAETPAILGLMDSLDFGRFSIIPWVELFDDSRIVFSLHPYRTDAPATSTAFEWVFDDNIVNSAAGLGGANADYLPNTDEVIWVEHDPALPSAEPGGPMPSFNVVKYRDSTGNIENIYHNAQRLPVSIVFINDGQTAAIQLMSPFDPMTNPPEPQVISWIALDRFGNILTLQEDITGNTQVMPARGGYAFFKHQFAPEQSSTYTLEYRTPDGVEVLWEIESRDAWAVVAYTEDAVDPTQLDPFQSITE